MSAAHDKAKKALADLTAALTEMDIEGGATGLLDYHSAWIADIVTDVQSHEEIYG